MKKISIIIISYNRPGDLSDLLKDITAFRDTALLEEVIILNNCSDVDYGGVNEFIKENPRIPFKLITSSENLGVARGRNYAAGKAVGDILFFIDDDVSLKDAATLQKLNTIFNDKKIDGRKLGIVSLKVFYEATNDYQVNAFPQKHFKKYRDRHEFLTYYYTGCAHAISRKAWLAAGNYPEDFFYGMEEYDLSYRMPGAGFYIKYDDAVTVLHKESPLGRKPKAEKLKMMWINKSIVAYRYLPKKYFYSTAFLWSLFFLKNSGFNFKMFISGWKELAKKIRTQQRRRVSSETMKYFKQTEARLWY